MSQNYKNQRNKSCFLHGNGCNLLYNPELLHEPEASLLSRGLFEKATQFSSITTGGRGQAWFVEISEISTVYRRYMRGGLMARINRQTYISLNLENTRSIQEWRLLQKMFELGLPVPQPVAASVCRWPVSFSPFYRAQILVKRIADVKTLDQLLTLGSLAAGQWQSVGQCIRRFHNVGIYHADLNANNILVDKTSKVYLIDFDKGELRSAEQQNTQWKQDNLQRLKRSLLKQQGIHENYHFTKEDWQLLVSAYDAWSE